MAVLSKMNDISLDQYDRAGDGNTDVSQLEGLNCSAGTKLVESF